MTKVRQRTILKAAARHWTPFQQMEITDEMRSKFSFLKNCYAIYHNSRFECHLFACNTRIGGVMQCNVRRHGDLEEITFMDLQRVKDEIFGLDCTAVEVHPQAEDLIKTHTKVRVLWVLPAGWEAPFGLGMKTAWGNPE